MSLSNYILQLSLLCSAICCFFTLSNWISSTAALYWDYLVLFEDFNLLEIQIVPHLLFTYKYYPFNKYRKTTNNQFKRYSIKEIWFFVTLSVAYFLKLINVIIIQRLRRSHSYHFTVLLQLVKDTKTILFFGYQPKQKTEHDTKLKLLHWYSFWQPIVSRSTEIV